MKKIKSMYIYLFIILQPIFDMIVYFTQDTKYSRLSFILRSLTLLVFCLYSFINIKNKKKLIILMLPICFFSVVHLFNSYINGDAIFSDIRNLVSIWQMPILAILLTFLINDDENIKKQITSGIVTNLIIIFVSIVLSLITHSYGTTYDDSGIVGWFTGTSTPSMILTVLCPLFLYYVNQKSNMFIYIFTNLIIFFLLATNGTRACYYSMVVLYLIMIFKNIVSSKNKTKYVKIFISIIFFASSILFYSYSATFRKQILKKESNVIDQEIIEKIEKIDIENENNNNENTNNNENNNSVPLEPKYTKEELIVLKKLQTSYIYVRLMNARGEMPVINKMKNIVSAETLSDNRLMKRINASILFEESSVSTKLIGLNFETVNKDEMDMENDLTAIFYYLGYIGFVIYFSYIIYFIYIAFKRICKNYKIIFNPEYVVLLYALALSFAGGELTGALLRKPNANFYVALALALLFLTCKDKKKLDKKDSKKKIKFLLLHLGYGGIETATINTANVLSDKYDVELVSLYSLKNNQEYKVNNNVKVRYLYNEGPNRDEFNKALKNKNIFEILKQGIKATWILFLKKYLIVREIINDDGNIIISTRMEFSVLLSKYGNENTLKIAQEHRYHDNDKKYINTIKNKYDNIDYLLALTKTLGNDYKKFLINNTHTKIVVLPNMLIHYPKKISKLDDVNIISIGRLHNGKRINELINIFSKIDNKKSKLFIIGDGEEYSNLSNQIKKLKIQNRVKLLGYMSSTEIEKYMYKSSVFLMTSITEGLPMVLLEAMSYGLPCIAYETKNGIGDIIVNNKNGYIIKNRNEKDYIKKLNLVLSNIELRKKFSEEAFNCSQKFSSHEIIKIWNRILD